MLALSLVTDKVYAMHLRGISGAGIARKLGLSPSAVAYHLRKAGIKPKAYATPEPARKGKRRCAVCGVAKTPGAFPSERNAACTVCIRSKS